MGRSSGAFFEGLIGFYTGFHEFTGFCKVVDEGSSASSPSAEAMGP